MSNYAKTLILIDQSDFTIDQRVQLIELILHGLEIDTIQGMADSEGKSYNGIKNSRRYPKIKIGRQTMAVKGVTKSNMPF